MQGTPGLFRVLLNKVARRFEDALPEPEGLGEGFGPGMSQVVGDIFYQADSAAGEAVDGLPVVSHQEVCHVRLSKRLQQLHSAAGDVLEFVHQYVGVGGLRNAFLQNLDPMLVGVFRLRWCSLR